MNEQVQQLKNKFKNIEKETITNSYFLPLTSKNQLKNQELLSFINKAKIGMPLKPQKI